VGGEDVVTTIAHSRALVDYVQRHVPMISSNNRDETMRTLAVLILCSQLSACGTLLAVADGVGTVAVYGIKTVINTVDAVTPDIVNKED
jgi:hypothetical protein